MTGPLLFAFRGVPVVAHWSLLAMFLYLIFALSGGYLAAEYPGLSAFSHFAMAFAISTALWVSVALHEFGHSLWGEREGMTTQRIVLFAFGGLAVFADPPPSARASLRVLLAGPAVTAALVLVCAGSAALLEASGASEALTGTLVFVAVLNASLLVFNLLPAYPLDGGQALAALLLGRGMAVERVRTLVLRFGIAAGAAAVAIGVLGPLLDLLRADTPGGVLIGAGTLTFWGIVVIFLAGSVRSAPLGYFMPREFVVGDLLEPGPFEVKTGNSISGFMAELGRVRGHSTVALPVMRGDEIAGVVSPGLAARVPPNQRDKTAVDEIMLGKDNSTVLEPGTPLTEAYEALTEGSPDGVVVEDGRLLGVVTRPMVAQALLSARARARRGVNWPQGRSDAAV